MEQLPQPWVEAIQSWASSEPLILAVYVFGSRAKGTAVDGSDLDIAIKVDGRDSGEALANAIFGKQKWVSLLSKAIPAAIDLQSMFPDDVVVTPAVNEHGRLIFERT